MLQDYIKIFRLFLVTIFLFSGLVSAANSQTTFVEGQDYIKLSDSVRVNQSVAQLLASDPEKVQVIFFFSYACHGCEMMHAPFEQWAVKRKAIPNNKTVVYTYPVSFNAQWAMLAKLFYVVEILDPTGKLNQDIFVAVHKKGLKLWDVAVMRKFFIQHGYTAAQFDEAYNSFNLKRQLKRAEDLAKGYNISATPDIIINGPVHSYKLDLTKAGNDIPRLIKIINYLVVRESKLL